MTRFRWKKENECVNVTYLYDWLDFISHRITSLTIHNYFNWNTWPNSVKIMYVELKNTEYHCNLFSLLKEFTNKLKLIPNRRGTNLSPLFKLKYFSYITAPVRKSGFSTLHNVRLVDLISNDYSWKTCFGRSNRCGCSGLFLTQFYLKYTGNVYLFVSNGFHEIRNSCPYGFFYTVLTKVVFWISNSVS